MHGKDKLGGKIDVETQASRLLLGSTFEEEEAEMMLYALSENEV